MAKINLTNRFIQSVKVDKRTDFRDGVLPGLILRVTPSDVKSWNIVYSRQSDARKRRFTLGRYPAIDLQNARKRALNELAKIADGADPAHRDTGALTVEDLGGQFIEAYAKLKKRSWAEDERILTVDVYPKIGQMGANKVRRQHLAQLIDAKVSTGSTAMSTKLLAVLRKMFNWAEEEELVQINPAARIRPRVKPTRRERFLSFEEVDQLLQRLDGAAMHDDVRCVLRLLVLTGQRSGEVCGMTKREIDPLRREWNIPSNRTKNGLPHMVPLSEEAWRIVDLALARLEFANADAPLFARTGEALKAKGVGNAVRRNQEYFGLDKWTPHDLRRTVATGMGEIGVQPHIIEAVLNHQSGSKSGVAGTYNRAVYRAEKRVAVDEWGRKIFLQVSHCFYRVVT